MQVQALAQELVGTAAALFAAHTEAADTVVDTVVDTAAAVGHIVAAGDTVVDTAAAADTVGHIAVAVVVASFRMVADISRPM